MLFIYGLYFGIAVTLSVAATFFVRALAVRYEIMDVPGGARKKHQHPVALLGGVAIFLSFWLVVAFVFVADPRYGVDILAGKLQWMLVASAIIMVLGIADDIRSLPALVRLAVVAVAVIIAVAGGVILEKITNPFGGILYFAAWISALLAFVWLLGMSYTTKILDGLDGLSTGVVTIGALIIFFLTNTKTFYQPNVGLLSIIFAGSCFGFWLFNFHPAKIFLGEGGSLLLGFMLGVLAIISGGKVATALLVMAIPIFDLIRVAYKRVRRKQSVLVGDREHLHFRLLDAGFSHRQAVLFLYSIALVFGLSTLFLQSYQKLLVLVGISLFMLVLNMYVEHRITVKKVK